MKTRKRETDAFGNFTAPDRRFKPALCKVFASPRFVELNRMLKTIAHELAANYGNEPCTINFVGTLITLEIGKRAKVYAYRRVKGMRVTSRDNLLVECMFHDTGERYSDETLLAMVASGCGRRALFDPSNPTPINTRKIRSDKGKPKPKRKRSSALAVIDPFKKES